MKQVQSESAVRLFRGMGGSLLWLAGCLWTSCERQLAPHTRIIPSVYNLVLTRSSSTAWILTGKLDSLALIIMNRDTREVVERWQFDIQVEEPPEAGGSSSGGGGGKENEG